MTDEFITSHPFRIDLADGCHIRFRDLVGAARTAMDRRTGLWDEEKQRGYSAADCRMIVNSQGRYGRA